MRKSAIRIVVIVAAASGVGLGYAGLRGFAFAPDVAAVQARLTKKADVHAQRDAIRARHGIDLAEFKRLIAAGAFVVDARPAKAFAEGHLALPETAFVPTLNIEPARVIEEQGRLFALQQLMGPGQVLVLYCTSDECDLAEELLTELQRLGFDATAVRLFVPGWAALEKTDLPRARGADAWTGELPGVPAAAAVEEGGG